MSVAQGKSKPIIKVTDTEMKFANLSKDMGKQSFISRVATLEF